MLFDVPAPPSLPITGDTRRFPINRVFCVGRNYAAHAAEMGNEVERDAPFYFTKGPHAVAQAGSTLPYPPGTESYHYEVECVAAIGSSGFQVAEADAMDLVWGYGVGLDMTRRDLQAAAKKKGLPWDTAKDVEHSAVLGPLAPAADFGALGAQRLRLTQNGASVQDAPLSDMVWSLPELIAHLSTLYHLQAGDLIMTGTPAGVGPVEPGDHLIGTLDGCAPVSVRYTGPET
ncbi:fumarylacetoacetate hydrolase family protein [Shimia ponticola]|uniref:fumarylacetoacetate hydrolase family protein n=1 Tax=Shimia ponticola TaxID=2582893 RepID=UPI00164BF6CB|nr:fumarylacetoacetate hydrolase family protein [Shimia ponticola]